MPAIDPILTNVSRTLRPDAICLDYRFTQSLGPVALEDVSQGIISHTWMARVDELNNIWLARRNDADTDWNPESIFFTFAGVAAVELDLAFDQQGRIVFTVERPTGAGGTAEVWLYYFNTVTAVYEFSNFGRGRNPRLLLDDELGSSNSDVLWFYMDDTIDRLVYRVQRDRYLVKNTLTRNDATQVVAANAFVDEVFKSVDGRVVVTCLVRDLVSGHYAQSRIESSLYPRILDVDKFQAGAPTVIADFSDLHVVIIYIVASDSSTTPQQAPQGFIDSDKFTPTSVALQGGLVEVFTVIDMGPGSGLDADKFQASSVVLMSGLIEVVVIARTIEADEFQAQNLLLVAAGSSLPVVVISHTLFDIDQFQASSVTLQAAGSSLA